MCLPPQPIMKKYTTTDWNKAYKQGRKFSPVSELLLDKLNLKGTTVLDIGCGTGELLKQLERRGFFVCGIDLAEECNPDIVGDVMKAKLDTYDIIFANKVIAFNKLKPFLKRCKALLEDGGCLVIITPVTSKKHAYDAHMKSISVDTQELEEALVKVFGSFELVYSQYLDNTYGCINTYRVYK